MRKLVLVGTCSVVIFVPAVAQAKSPTRRHIGVYYYLRRHVVDRFGPEAPGRDIVRDNLRNGHRVTDQAVVASNSIMERMLIVQYQNIVPTSIQTPITTATTPTQSSFSSSYVPSSSYSGGYSIPSSIVQCESGGNWSAVNPSSGAGGAYQILPSTWSAYGGQGLPQNASPAEQSRIAGLIYAHDGASAWVCK